MPAPQTTLLIEGGFRELAEELADFIDTLRTASDESAPSLKQELTPHLEAYTKAEGEQNADELDNAKDEVLEGLVDASGALVLASEKDFVPSYNLLLHLISQASELNDYLQPICKNLSQAAASAENATARGPLVLTVLTTIFNILPANDGIHVPIFSAILDVIARSPYAFENLSTYLKRLDAWLEQWGTKPDAARRLYVKISGIAKEAGEADESYLYLTKALRTIPTADGGSDEARKLAVEALSRALISPTQFDFEDLTSIDAVQALRTGPDATWYQLLDVFTADTLEEYEAFKSENPSFLAKAGLADEVLTRKMRLLTLASLAASASQTRQLPYTQIASALRIPADEVEMWVIDVIRAGLVEGKLSQQNQQFLIHRSTYRVFGDNQWREVAGRLDMWRSSLVSVLETIRAEKEALVQQREQEQRQLDGKGRGPRRQDRDVVDVAMD